MEVMSMKCPKCGRVLNEGENYCSTCGIYVDQNNNAKKNKTNIFLIILSIILPFVGIALFLVKWKSNPRRSKAYGIASVVGMILWIVFVISYVVFNFFFFYRVFSELFRDIRNRNSDKEETKINYDGTPWYDYTLIYDGISFTLPLSYEEFSNITGYALNEDVERKFLRRDECSSKNVYKDEMSVTLTFCNDSNRGHEFSDATITEVKQRMVDYGDDDQKFIFPNNLVIGQKMTQKDIGDVFDKPTLINYRGSTNFTYYASYYYALNSDKINEGFYGITLLLEEEKIYELVLGRNQK